MRGLVWFRRDLRVRDNPALIAALEECDEVVPLFVFDDPLLQSHVFGSACVNFMLGCLQELSDTLAQLGLDLIWRRGEQVTEVSQLANELNIDRVYWSRDYDPDAVHRDRTVQQWMARSGVAVRTFKDHVVFEAEEVRGSSGAPLQRYSAYRNRWWDRWRAGPPPVLKLPRRRGPAFRRTAVVPDSRRWPSAKDLGYEAASLWIQPGEEAGHQRLRWFLDGPVHQYATGRNLPGVDGTSRLSPHFRFGTVSPRTAVHTALARLERGEPGSRSSVMTWINELVWREFFQQVLSAFPRVATSPFRPDAVVAPPRKPGPEHDRLFRAWCDGRTGYPIVDAGMRQLNQTGWMHNRVRLIVASFLIKDLRLDWRSGEEYFMQHLLDGDLAANNGNWQWCAATGTDSMPGYRIFNPVLQSKRFDAHGDYIRTYVPELARVPSARIHEPHVMTTEEQRHAAVRIGRDYPRPIVEHDRARNEYLALVRHVRGRA